MADTATRVVTRLSNSAVGSQFVTVDDAQEKLEAAHRRGSVSRSNASFGKHSYQSRALFLAQLLPRPRRLVINRPETTNESTCRPTDPG